MPVTAEITETLIRDYINRAVSDVFKTMLGRVPTFSAQEPLRGDEPLPSPEGHRPQVVGTVGFIGDINGLIYLHLDLGFARICTCHLLGMTEAELDEAGDEVINDAIGEITNMIAGSFRTKMATEGDAWAISVPTVTMGSDFYIKPFSNGRRILLPFRMNDNDVYVELILTKQR